MPNYVYCIIGAVALVALLFAVYKLLGVDKVKAWLLWAVTEAEKQFGNGTGKLKLAYVYDLFIAKFPKLQTIIPYSLFSNLVDQALVVMRQMLENEKIAELIVGKEVGDVNG